MDYGKKILILILTGVCALAMLLAPFRSKADDFWKILKDVDYLQTVASPSEQPRWKQYFKTLSYQAKPLRNEVFRDMLKKFGSFDTPTKKGVIAGLQDIRNFLPEEFRWLLAAWEVDNGVPNRNTLEDSKTAVLNTMFRKLRTANETLDIDAMSEKYLIYYEPGAVKTQQGLVEVNLVRLNSREDLLFLHSRWQAAASTLSDQYRLTQKRLQYLHAVESTARLLTPKTVRDLFEYMDSPQFLGSGTYYERLCMTDIWQIVRQMRWSYALKIDGEDNTLSEDYTPQYKADMQAILAYFKKWSSPNLGFLISHYEGLQEARLSSIEELFARDMNASDLTILNTIVTSRKFDSENFFLMDGEGMRPDSYLLALSLWFAKNTAPVDEKTEAGIYKSFLKIVSNAENYRKGVRIGNDRNETWMAAKDFNLLLQKFFEAHKNRKMPSKVAAWLLEHNAFKTNSMSDKEWNKLEFLRLEAVENSMPAAEFKEALIRKVLGIDAKLRDRLLAAKYLRTKMKVPDLEQIALRLKAHAEGTKLEKFENVSPKTWAKDDSQLVTVMSALNPLDAGLRDYLSDIFVNMKLDNPMIGPKDALGRLAEIGFAPDWLRVKLLDLLNFESGDSIGYFSSFLTLFPHDGKSITEIVYHHRRGPLVKMLTLLMEYARQDSSIITSIRKGIEASDRSEASLFLYKGLPLDQFLQKYAGLSNENSPRISPACGIDVSKLSKAEGQ